MKLSVSCRVFNMNYDAGKLDNIIAGGINNGDTALMTILAEVEEKAALSCVNVTENIKETASWGISITVPQTREDT